MQVTWTVSPVGYQRIARRCPACNTKRDFLPAGAFRMNSQKKILDVWSIYKCTHCEYTWNISLFSRLPVSRINRDLYSRIMANDEATLEYFSHDDQILKRNNVELSGVPEFQVREQWSAGHLCNKRLKITVRLRCSFQVSLLSILRKQLSLSASEIKRRVVAGEIVGVTLKELKSTTRRTSGFEIGISVGAFYSARKIDLRNTGNPKN
ncbi:DUF1062 domain-containing protein [Trabulsiella odontotermitis]|uniref:DUF1062 domain-containing protein n=1 Tax=Trabulsiella odontotermitis TaxID=379893 RepID=A0A0L0H4J9_9ENTR|nr:DUF1062 domain-containing protein [Trabulsiella odontotermitis]KNC95643.1 hypothetical protein GM31_23135 [Trabulsiella odontotermitis]